MLAVVSDGGRMKITATRHDLTPTAEYPTISEVQITCADEETSTDLLEVFICLMLALGYQKGSIAEALAIKSEEYGECK